MFTCQRIVVRNLIAMIFLTTATFVASSNASAQGVTLGPTGRYSTTPTLSPYLDLLRSGGGALPNYQQFVRPRLRLRNELVNQSREIARQNREIQVLNQRSRRPDTVPSGTGTPSRFLDYSSFYPLLSR